MTSPFNSLQPAGCLDGMRDMPAKQKMYAEAGDLRVLGVDVPADVPADRPVEISAGNLRAAITSWLERNPVPAGELAPDQPLDAGVSPETPDADEPGDDDDDFDLQPDPEFPALV